MPMDSESEQLWENVAPDLQPLCRKLRELVVGLDPQCTEIVWLKQGIASYGVGPKKMSEHYVYIAPKSQHVNFGFYYGASLDDPAGLMEGSGKQMRHIKLRNPAEAQSAPMEALIVKAIAERKQALS